jgi:hypothetical protein
MKQDFLFRRRIEAVVFMAVFFAVFGYLGHHMGVANMLNSIMKTAHDLLMNTVFYIMGVTVLTGALGKLLVEFGVIRLLELFLSPFMRPVFGLPGVASLGGLMTFFSDNPAIISLAKDRNFSAYFKRYQLVSLTNFGTTFGMGMIVITYMAGLGYFMPAFIGGIGALIGGIVSTRLMQRLTRGLIPEDEAADAAQGDEQKLVFKSEGGIFLRLLNAVLDGGKSGVDLALSIIPGVLIISTMVMMVTFGPAQPEVGYQGLAYEGVPVLPRIASLFAPISHFLFGFKSPEMVAFPITSLGAVGAALSLVKTFVAKGMITGNDVAVFTAMGMCWSGFLSTHTAMLDALGYRRLTSRALLSHTLGGLVAGIAAHNLHWLSTLL